MTEQLTILLVPHTHWDREWYQTFQQFRMRLVRVVNHLLDILDSDSNFTHFMLDGQTIVLDDYLEVCPQEEERLKRYTRSGRISVGPWYLQPDEFLVSGESLIRNLQVGLRRAAEFGQPMRVGYVPDTFGHIAQLPQILRGVGIDNAVFWRGIGSEARKSEFTWTAPDGSSVLVLLLADPLGYSNARDMPLQVDEFVTRTELQASRLLPRANQATLLFMNGSDHLAPQDGLPAVVAAANERMEHLDPQRARVLAGFQRDGQPVSFDKIQVRIASLSEYVDTVSHYIRQNGKHALQTMAGEMRSGEYSHLLPSVLSTRMWIKQENAATEHLLERWVEPLAAWASLLGARYPRGLVELAWKYLLQNHPHDSICGCSIDQVHRENRVRFAQSQQVGEQLVTEAMQHIESRIDTRPLAKPEQQSRGAIPLVVFNPAPGPRSEAVQVEAQLANIGEAAIIQDEQGASMPFSVLKRWRQELGSMPIEREMIATAVALQGSYQPGDFIHLAQSTIGSFLGFVGEPGKGFEISDVQVREGEQPGIVAVDLMLTPPGQAIIHERQLLDAEQHILSLLPREDISTFVFSVADLARATLEFVAADLPGYGYKTYWLYPLGLDNAATPASTLSISARSIENEFFHVEANSVDGSLTVTDKQSGAIYTGLNRFVDGGDVGDLYNYSPPAQDTFVTVPVEAPSIEVLSSSVQARMQIAARYALPAACSIDRTARSGERVECAIASEVTLVPGVRRIDIHTVVDNRAKDHRLRVAFPVPFTVESSYAEGTFEVRERPVETPRPENLAEWSEEPVNCYPQKRFVDVCDGALGLGVLNRGLPEYEITSDDAGRMAIALTLLRCVEWLSRGDLSTRRGHAGPMELTPEAQCQGINEFDYALVPHSGDWEADESLVLREAQAFNMPVRVVAGSQHEGDLPSLSALLSVEPRSLVVSAIKRANNDEGMLVRVYNPSGHAIEATIRPGFASERVYAANLLEEQDEQLFWQGGEPLHVGVRGGEIVTLLFM